MPARFDTVNGLIENARFAVEQMRDPPGGLANGDGCKQAMAAYNSLVLRARRVIGDDACTGLAPCDIVRSRPFPAPCAWCYVQWDHIRSSLRQLLRFLEDAKTQSLRIDCRKSRHS